MTVQTFLFIWETEARDELRYYYYSFSMAEDREANLYYVYGVATISRLLKIVGLFRKRAL